MPLMKNFFLEKQPMEWDNFNYISYGVIYSSYRNINFKPQPHEVFDEDLKVAKFLLASVCMGQSSIAQTKTLKINAK